MGSLVNRRRYSSGGKKDERLLPYGYFELKYIENTSNAYIDTGVSFNSDLNISCTFRNTLPRSTTRNLRVFGGCAGWRTTGISLAENALVYNNAIKDISFYNITDKIQFEFINLQYKFSGGLNAQGSFSRTTDDVNPSITLFAEHRPDDILSNFIGCIYNFNIEGKINLIPCLSPDNEVGMYDTVTKTFFKSPNGTAFVAGPKIYDGDDRTAPYDYEVEYLESSGTQWIDTEVEGNWSNGLIVELDMLLPQGYNGEVDFFGALTSMYSEYNYAGCFMTLGNNFVLQLRNPYVKYGVNDYNRHIHIYNSNTKKIIFDNNIIEAIKLGWTVTSNSNFCLFQRPDMSTPATSLLYSAKFTRNNVLIRDFIPVVKDGVGCMYDKVSGTFFYNQGTGDFIVGPRVIHCTDNDYYGIRWLATDAPDSPIIRIGNMNWHRTLPIHSKMRRCILGDDGSKRYVSDSDYTKDTDGNAIDYTASSANGVTYDTAVEMPEHCFLTGTETIDNVDYHYIKLFPNLMIGNFVPTHYMGAFEAMLDRTNNKLYSTVKANIAYNNDGEVDGADLTYAENWRGGNNSSSYDSDSAKTLMGRAVTNINITNFCTYANNRGSYYGITNWAARNNLCRLYAVEYANFNSQADYNPELNAYGYHQGGLGFGVCSTTDAWNAYNAYNPIMPCGVTLKLGSKTGIVRYNLGATYSSGATAATYFDVPSYRGVENPFAHIWENATGMYIHGSNSVNNIYVAEDGFHARTFPTTTSNTAPSGYKLRSSSLPWANGWPATLDWNDDGDFLAKTLDTSSTTADNKSILRDYFWGQNANAKKLMVSGGLDSSVRTGLFTVYVKHLAVGAVFAGDGARLLTVPKYNE